MPIPSSWKRHCTIMLCNLMRKQKVNDSMGTILFVGIRIKFSLNEDFWGSEMKSVLNSASPLPLPAWICPNTNAKMAIDTILVNPLWYISIYIECKPNERLVWSLNIGSYMDSKLHPTYQNCRLRMSFILEKLVRS